MADSRKSLRLENIPVMNFGKFVIEKLKNFADAEALVSIKFLFS